ncbi:MAG: hypothetical protein EB036_01830 [Betaproteobacteria bacterium]|nr:hypothetical protein [Betaproteobacteria bacterium]
MNNEKKIKLQTQSASICTNINSFAFERLKSSNGVGEIAAEPRQLQWSKRFAQPQRSGSPIVFSWLVWCEPCQKRRVDSRVVLLLTSI